MLPQKLKDQVFKLSPRDRLELVSVIIESLQDTVTTTPDHKKAIQRMRGLLKTNHPAPTDKEVTAMLEDRRVEKYL